jgi:hypothetical protein
MVMVMVMHTITQCILQSIIYMGRGPRHHAHTITTIIMEAIMYHDDEHHRGALKRASKWLSKGLQKGLRDDPGPLRSQIPWIPDPLDPRSSGSQILWIPDPMMTRSHEDQILVPRYPVASTSPYSSASPRGRCRDYHGECSTCAIPCTLHARMPASMHEHYNERGCHVLCIACTSTFPPSVLLSLSILSKLRNGDEESKYSKSISTSYHPEDEHEEHYPKSRYSLSSPCSATTTRRAGTLLSSLRRIPTSRYSTILSAEYTNEQVLSTSSNGE